MKDNKKIINELAINELDTVAGGALFETYSDEDYQAAGVEVVGSGFFTNDGYRFNGQEIDSVDADLLVKYSDTFGGIAPSLDVALEKLGEYINKHPTRIGY